MTFLPIAARELLVASRRKTTFRVRLLTAIGSAITGFLLLGFSSNAARSTGEVMFTVLMGGGFLFAVFAGVLLAADSLSEEKRDGTLGLLFLTDLGGFDIITGKLLIVGLNALLALLAGLPVAAVAWILGGVTGGEFWRCALVLLNTLFLSLAVGLAVSARRRMQTEALLRTFLWLAAITFGLGLLHRGWGTRQFGEQVRWWLGVSPWVSFQWAKDLPYRADPARFWSAIWLAHLTAWGFVVAASWTVTRRWQDVPVVTPAKSALEVEIAQGGRSVTVTRRGFSLRSELLDTNPVASLLVGDTRLRLWAWLAVGATMLLLTVNLLVGGEPAMPLSFLIFTAGQSGSLLLATALTALLLGIKTMFAWQACEFFATSRRQGALDALLTTPLRDSELFLGQWMALRRNFTAPLVTLGVILAVGPLMHVLAGPQLATATSNSMNLTLGGIWLYHVINLPLELMAIAWCGMWFALTQTRPNWAFAKTVLFVVVLPQVLFCVPSLLVAGAVFSYARGKFNVPIRAALQGIHDPAQWRKLNSRLG